MAEVAHTLPNGHVIIVNDDRRKTAINLDDVYSYRMIDSSSAVTVTEGTIVPNEEDLIWSFKMGFFRAARVDYTSFVVDLTKWEEPKSDSDLPVNDVFLGTGPGYTSETWRVYLDTRVFPYRLDVDDQVRIYGSEAHHIVIYKGIDTSENGEVVSEYYNQAGDYIEGGEIPLEVVGTQAISVTTPVALVVNVAVKAPVMGYSHTAMADGEVVTVVTYNAQNGITSQARMLIHNTNLVRHPSDAMKRVKSIELISSYLSKTEPNTIEFPINATAASLGLQGKVTYTDGTTLTQPVVDEDSNGKFKLLGLKYWSSTITGIDQEMTLTYTLSPGEYSYLQGVTSNNAVRETYNVRVRPMDIAFSFKLFAWPTWGGDVVGYKLDFYLYDLNRAVARRVPTGAVTLANGGASFDGHDYLTTQFLNFSVDLGAVDSAYQGKTHAQQSQISLLRDGGIAATNWKVKFAASQPEWYGTDVKASVHAGSGGLSTVNLKNGAANLDQWLAKLYYMTQPVYDPQTETRAPAPTHFIITTKTREYVVPVSNWLNDITIINDLTEGTNMYLKWVKQTSTGYLQLGVSGLPVHAI